MHIRSKQQMRQPDPHKCFATSWSTARFRDRLCSRQPCIASVLSPCGAIRLAFADIIVALVRRGTSDTVAHSIRILIDVSRILADAASCTAEGALSIWVFALRVGCDNVVAMNNPCASDYDV